MAFLKPQSPLARGDDYFYPLTTADQVILSNGLRMEDVVGKTRTQTITLYQNGWSAQAPYCYSITVKELNDRIPARVYPVYPSDVSLDNKIAYKEELAKITHCERDGMIMTFECWEDVPAMDLVVEVEMSVLYPLEGSINMDDIESLLPKINYSVVGGTTEPSNPTENMIWINTDTEITKVIFKSIKPSNPVEGMVCIYTGASSNVSFDRIVINGIGIDEVYPISAIQYISGAWVDKTAKSYQGGKWVDWYGGELYKNGKEYEHITGGWMTSSYDGSAGGTVTKNENNITLSANSNGFAITVTGKSINLNGKSKLKVLFDSMNTVPQASRAVAVSLHSGATPTSNNRIAQELTQSNKTELTLDTSTQSGSYWVAVRCQYGATATFSEVVLE